MSAGMEQICQVMADYLNGQGVSAAAAWPARLRQEQKETLVVVSLRGCEAGPSGFQDYLGERYDAQTGRWTEWYGRRARLTIGLDLYAPEGGDGQAVQRAFDALAGALILGGPEGLRVEEFSCGQTAYDPDSRRLMRPVQAVCGAWLCAAAGADGAFTDFELRGVIEA